ncbi:hypothetical protein H9P43_005968 [Blastocladiella emersonii ATCC 22665]|nr:hypothetical protein H9P43_005968 [Blastocladiella emersonii ATCC 22665]
MSLPNPRRRRSPTADADPATLAFPDLVARIDQVEIQLRALEEASRSRKATPERRPRSRASTHDEVSDADKFAELRPQFRDLCERAILLACTETTTDVVSHMGDLSSSGTATPPPSRGRRNQKPAPSPPAAPALVERAFEDRVWRFVFYPEIEVLRGELKRATAEPDVQRITTNLAVCLDRATEYFDGLVQTLLARYELKLEFSTGMAVRFRLLDPEASRAAVSVHRCLVYLGDLARYRQSHVHTTSNRAAASWAAVVSYYQSSLLLYPSGRPCSQLAMIQRQCGQDFEVAYWAVRGVGACHTATVCTDNLGVLYSQLLHESRVNRCPPFLRLHAEMLRGGGPVTLKLTPPRPATPYAESLATWLPQVTAALRAHPPAECAIILAVTIGSLLPGEGQDGGDMIGRHLRYISALALLARLALVDAQAALVFATWALANPGRVRSIVAVALSPELRRISDGLIDLEADLRLLLEFLDPDNVDTDHLPQWCLGVDALLCQLGCMSNFYPTWLDAANLAPILTEPPFTASANGGGSGTATPVPHAHVSDPGRLLGLADLLSDVLPALSVEPATPTNGTLRMVRGSSGMHLARSLAPWLLVPALDVFRGNQPKAASPAWRALKSVLEREACRVLIPLYVIEYLDQSKKYSSVARDAIRTFEAQIRHQAGSGVLELQRHVPGTTPPPPSFRTVDLAPETIADEQMDALTDCRADFLAHHRRESGSDVDAFVVVTDDAATQEACEANGFRWVEPAGIEALVESTAP